MAFHINDAAPQTTNDFGTAVYRNRFISAEWLYSITTFTQYTQNGFTTFTQYTQATSQIITKFLQNVKSRLSINANFSTNLFNFYHESSSHGDSRTNFVRCKGICIVWLNIGYTELNVSENSTLINPNSDNGSQDPTFMGNKGALPDGYEYVSGYILGFHENYQVIIFS